MSVKIIDNEAFYGFRVRRTVDGLLYQEFFPLKKAGRRLGKRETRRIEKLAEARDVQLKLQQEKARRRSKAERCFHSDGRVRGISYLIKTEKSGTKTPIFQVGVASELEGKIFCASFSINALGVEKSWARAIEAFARHKKISRSSKLYKSLLAARPEVDLPAGHAARCVDGQAGVERDAHRHSTANMPTVPQSNRGAKAVARKRGGAHARKREIGGRA